MSSFSQRLSDAILRTKTPLVVGLDPRLENLPKTYAPLVNGNIWDQAQAIREFCYWVIDVVADLVPAVKPQLAFFEELGPAGTQALADVVRYAREKQLLIIGDGKRGDIGTTASAYANAYLGVHSPWGMDSLTINPYLGVDTLQPFVQTARQRAAGIFVLVKTSNKGSGDFQDLIMRSESAAAETLYQRVAAELNRLAHEANAATDTYNLCEIGAVVGATYPQQLVDLRERMPKCWLLIPGFGAQGGTAQDTAGGFHPNGLGAIVNSSRAILYSFDPDDHSHGWVDAVRQATHNANQQLRDGTPAANL
ncbi:MAG: orotidine-5'-phosphate decarboxylase [Planctomycetaceae bacterium]|nr:orotidine-5'-phosphate decarboxylase [Planctomycetaceae bacterium]